MDDPRQVPGWTQQREPPDDSEVTLLKEMQGDGYSMTEIELNEMFEKLGGQEHLDMIESLKLKDFCTESSTKDTITWKLTEQGRKAIGL
jgi:hypothetical protein